VPKEASAQIVEKKSTFIAHVKNIETEQEAYQFIEDIKKKYWDARHNVYAYYIGGENQVHKYSDDGEPSGTAGVPILEIIKKEGIEDVVVVVTRYFGGILLGTGGLARAYSKSAKEGIIAAGVVKKTLCQILQIKIEYTLLGKLQNHINERGYKFLNLTYSDFIDSSIAIPIGEKEKFGEWFCELTAGKGIIKKVGEGYWVL
jgi:uncharacterized YigZ family protein